MFNKLTHRLMDKSVNCAPFFFKTIEPLQTRANKWFLIFPNALLKAYKQEKH